MYFINKKNLLIIIYKINLKIENKNVFKNIWILIVLK